MKIFYLTLPGVRADVAVIRGIVSGPFDVRLPPYHGPSSCVWIVPGTEKP